MLLFITVPYLVYDELIIIPSISLHLLSLITWSILSFEPRPKPLQFTEKIVIPLFLISVTPPLTLISQHLYCLLLLTSLVLFYPIAPSTSFSISSFYSFWLLLLSLLLHSSHLLTVFHVIILSHASHFCRISSLIIYTFLFIIFTISFWIFFCAFVHNIPIIFKSYFICLLAGIFCCTRSSFLSFSFSRYSTLFNCLCVSSWCVLNYLLICHSCYWIFLSSCTFQ